MNQLMVTPVIIHIDVTCQKAQPLTYHKLLREDASIFIHN